MQQNNSNILLATILSMIIIICWSFFYQEDTKSNIQGKSNTSNSDKIIPNKILQKTKHTKKSLKQIILESNNQRVVVSNDKLDGSISLKGARFDHLVLKKYFDSVDKEGKNITLLSPYETGEYYFTDFGWLSSNSNLILPTPETIWKSSSNTLDANRPVVLTWDNGQDIIFKITIELDKNYMFFITQTVKNNSEKDIVISSYGRVSRVINNPNKPNFILHEGGIAVFDNILHEESYSDISKEKNISFNNTKGWVGLTDKYWLTSLVPDKETNVNANFFYEDKSYNSSFVSDEFTVISKKDITLEHKFFAGAKEVSLLDEYQDKYNISLFDRAVDFGWYYFLTKPFFTFLSFFKKIFGNYGISILIVTVIIKLIMFPLANKTYRNINRIKQIQPKILSLREDFKDNKMEMNKKLMELYKSENINPASGCLPLLVQIPVFFSLYKVLYVTIDMRHAPFYGWIKDLSAPDTTSIFNLFGLLPFDPVFYIGVLPILMGLTMFIQQKISPAVTDPTQAKVMKILPFVLIFLFAGFPAGLLIYWIWSNILTIVQQLILRVKS